MTPGANDFPTQPPAFRAALRDRLSALARSRGHGLDELQRQVTHDRLLARAFTALDVDCWILNDRLRSPVPLARHPKARQSRDVDISARSSRPTTVPTDR